MAEANFIRLALDGYAKLNTRSQNNLIGVDARLTRIICAAIARYPRPVQVTEGLRSKERQAEMVAKKLSKTYKSKHLLGQAVDVYVNNCWELRYYREFADVVKEVAKEVNTPVTWGGDWKTLVDGPHFELPS